MGHHPQQHHCHHPTCASFGADGVQPPQQLLKPRPTLTATRRSRMMVSTTNELIDYYCNALVVAVVDCNY